MYNKTIIVKNRSGNETLELSFEEFKTQFDKELRQAISVYKAHESQRKAMLLPPFTPDNNDYTSDFYFDLRWNFNNYAQTSWYIANIR